MRSLLAGLRTLILPWGALPTEPRMVLGPTIPADLTAFYASESIVYANILMYADGNDYIYDALILDSSNDPARVVGRSASGVVAEVYRISAGAPPAVRFGVYSPGASLSLDGSSSIILDTGAAIEMAANSVLDITAGATVDYDGESMVENSSWTPIWTSSGGGFALGTGTSDGEYRKIGRLCFVLARLTCGNTTTLGGGSLGTTNLPFPPDYDFQKIIGHARDASASGNTDLFGRLTASGSGSITQITQAATGAVVNNASPFIPAVNDQYILTGWYTTDS